MSDLVVLSPGETDLHRIVDAIRQLQERYPATEDSAASSATAADVAAILATQIIAGAGLTGGGDLSANRTLNVGAGTAITVNANDVAVSMDGVTNTLLANMAANTLKGSLAGGDPADLTADEAAQLLRSGTGAQSVLQSKVISFTRDLTAATGSVAYTGVGFKPTCLVAIAYVNATTTFTVGFSAKDLSTGTVDFYGNNLVTSNGAFLQIQ